MKKNKIILIFIITLTILTSCYLFITTSNNKKSLTEDAKKFKQEYEQLNAENVEMDIPENNPIIYVDLIETIDILKNGNGIILFGFPECPWCRNIIPVLIDAANKNNIKQVYYLNPKSYRGTDNEEYKELINILSSYLKTNEDGEKTLYVPDVYFIKNGKIIGNQLGSVETQEDPYIPLDKNQEMELYNIYSNYINEIK